MKITKNRYLAGFATVVVVLALTRCIFPSIAMDRVAASPENDSIDNNLLTKADVETMQHNDSAKLKTESRFFKNDGTVVKNRIWSVSSYANAFPDNNDVQLTAANKWGVKPVSDRKEAEHRKKELVYIGANPYYHIDDRMYRSIPYLVPRAAVLLNDMGRAFYDSLQMKGVPLHRFIVSSVLRTKDDVKKLRNYNGNATENSCHLYGTTVDICYNRYKTVSDPDGNERRAVSNDTLKWILSEVMNDMRQNGRCYVKYEVKQGCFHLTVR